MKRNGGLRRRFGMWFGVTTSAFLLAFSAVVYGFFYNTTLNGLDRELAVRAEELFARCVVRGDQIEFESVGEDPSVLKGLADLKWVDVRVWPSGARLFQRGQVPAGMEAEPVGPIDATYTLRHRTEEFETSAGGEPQEDSDDRVCELVAVPKADGIEPTVLVSVRLAANFEPFEARCDQFLLALLALDLIFVGGAALSGLVLARRMTAPIVALQEAAQSARQGNRQSLPRTGAHDELDDLAEVLESAFDSLNRALERQKRFTADAAHELRNPIASILSAVECLQRRPREPALNEELLQGLHIDAQRLREVLDGLLCLARFDREVGSDQLEPVSLAALIAGQFGVPNSVPNESPVLVAGDLVMQGVPSLLATLLRNLLENALRHSPEPNSVRVVLSADNRGGTIVVSDHGPGIPAKERERVFERFARGDSADSGLAGLGLSIARAIVDLHGGHIRIAASNIGTQIEIVFPLSNDAHQCGALNPTGCLQ